MKNKTIFDDPAFWLGVSVTCSALSVLTALLSIGLIFMGDK